MTFIDIKLYNSYISLLGFIEMLCAKKLEIILIVKTERKNFREYIDYNQNKVTLRVAFSMTKGIHISELCTMHWQDIDL